MARRFKRQDKQKKSALRASNACAHKQRIHKASVITAKKYVLNLSSYSLKDNEYILLAKRLKSIPSPKKSNVKRNLMSLRENSFLIPACGTLENYINKTKLELSSLPIKQYQDNLTRQEEQY